MSEIIVKSGDLKNQSGSSILSFNFVKINEKYYNVLLEAKLD